MIVKFLHRPSQSIQKTMNGVSVLRSMLAKPFAFPVCCRIQTIVTAVKGEWTQVHSLRTRHFSARGIWQLDQKAKDYRPPKWAVGIQEALDGCPSMGNVYPQWQYIFQ